MSYQNDFANQLSLHLPVGWAVETSLKNQRGVELYIVVMHSVTGFIVHDITFASTDWQALKISASNHIKEFVKNNFAGSQIMIGGDTKLAQRALKEAKQKGHDVVIPFKGRRFIPAFDLVVV